MSKSAIISQIDILSREIEMLETGDEYSNYGIGLFTQIEMLEEQLRSF